MGETRRVRPPAHRSARLVPRLVTFLLLTAAGALLLTDRTGLKTEYFALGAAWQGKPYYTTVGPPVLQEASEIREVLKTEVLFSVRWSGWWAVAEGGRHTFALDADDGGYLRIDGEVVVDTDGVFGKRRRKGRKTLLPGFHAVEIGLFQSDRESRLAVRRSAPRAGGKETEALPPADLYAGPPLTLRAAMRRALATWPRVYRQFLGALLLLAAVLLLRGLAPSARAPAAWLRARFAASASGRVRFALLLGLVAAAFFASLPFTGTVRGGDDTTYLKTALFVSPNWFFGRYAHVYLLRLFITLCGGDPFLGARVWWCFVFAVTVGSLAVAVASIGPTLQLRTIGVTLFVLLAQTSLLGRIGAAFADFSAMMFVTAAVAVYMHGLARARDRPPPRHEWHSLAVGALTVAAFRSKEVGAVLLLLPILLGFVDGRPDLRRFARRMLYWTVGVVGVVLVLVLLDGWILGDPFYGFDGDRLAKAQQMNFPDGLESRSAVTGWLDVIWKAGHPARLPLRYLWIGVFAAALAAVLGRRSVELRLLHLVPIAYLLALVVLYVKMPHPFSSRMLIPILPVACLMTGLLAHYAGLDRVAWRALLVPRILAPAIVAAAVLLLVVLPYWLGALELGEPQSVAGVLLPALGLGAVSYLALLLHRRQGLIAALVLAYVALFGLGFEYNRMTLAKGFAEQRSDLLLYPWNTFREEIEAARPGRVALSPDLQWRYQMSATTRGSLAQLALRRSDLRVVLSRNPPLGADLAIASRASYERWRRRAPALATGARWGPGGLLVLLDPQQATPAEPSATPEAIRQER